MGEKPGQIPQLDRDRVALGNTEDQPRDLCAPGGSRHACAPGSLAAAPYDVPNLYTRPRDGAGSSYSGAVWKDWQPLKGKPQPENLRNGPIIAPKGVAWLLKNIKTMGTGCEAVPRTLSSLFSYFL